MAYNFAVDGGTTIDDVIKKLGDSADAVEGEINAIFGSIEGLGEIWQGDSYETFKSKCESYRPALDALVVMLRAFADIYSSVADERDDKLIQGLKGAFTNF